MIEIFFAAIIVLILGGVVGIAVLLAFHLHWFQTSATKLLPSVRKKRMLEEARRAVAAADLSYKMATERARDTAAAKRSKVSVQIQASAAGKRTEDKSGPREHTLAELSRIADFARTPAGDPEFVSRVPDGERRRIQFRSRPRTDFESTALDSKESESPHVTTRRQLEHAHNSRD